MSNLVKKAKRLLKKGWDEGEIIGVLELSDALELDVLNESESFTGIILESKRQITAELKAARKAALEKFRDYATYSAASQENRTKLFSLVRQHLQDELGRDLTEATNIAAIAREDIDKRLDGQPSKRISAFPENWPTCEICHDIKTSDFYLDLTSLEITPACSDCVQAVDKKRKANASAPKEPHGNAG